MSLARAPFTAHPFLTNCHLQTLWSRIARYRPRTQLCWHSFELADGDFVDLAWSAPMAQVLADHDTPLVVVFHGLEGSVYSPYADHLMSYAQQRNWHAVTMHFRGCSGRPNRTHRAYHSGDTADACRLIEWLHQHTRKPLFAAGFSLGGNMLVKLLGERPTLPLQAAVSVSAPLALGPSSERIDQGFSRVYRNHLVGALKRKVLAKQVAGQLHGRLDLTASQLEKIVNFRTFDDLVTAPLHGFDGVDDYYTRCSGLQFLPQVQRPLLILHAQDDPFTCVSCIPEPALLPPSVTHELSQRGGHVGFVTSHNGKPRFWLSQRIFDFFQQHSCQKHSAQKQRGNHANTLSTTR